MQKWIDVRSDTVTQPTPEMLQAMMSAPLGDDVYSEDPTTNLLQEKLADLFGKKMALFVPSGTMSNQLAVKTHTQPGDELLCDSTCHIYTWEAGGPAVLSGVTCRTIEGQYGILDVAQLKDKIRPGNEHYVRTKLVCLENTHNRGGGKIYPLEKIKLISDWARENNLRMHLDGARLWNAIIASGISAKNWASHFDSVSVCFSKGLGCPIGSALIGSEEFIKQARRNRKLFGGAMRQSGVIAAAALYAIENHVERLAIDHQNAKLISQAIKNSRFFSLEPAEVETNLIWFRVDPDFANASRIANDARNCGILISPLTNEHLRICTHLNVNKTDCQKIIDFIESVH